MGSPVITGTSSVPVADIPLSLFSGTDSEISPSDCPEGVSPDNQDVAFVPGSVRVREGLKKLFALPAGSAPFVYQKTYIQPNGNPLSFYLDSNGILWIEDVVNNPAVQVQLATVTPGLYAQSCSAFGREYIAFSDLLHGSGTPYQYDGTFLDRVSQDGPGAAPVIGEYLPPAAALSGAGASPAVNIATITPADAQFVEVTPSGGGGDIGPDFNGSRSLNSL